MTIELRKIYLRNYDITVHSSREEQYISIRIYSSSFIVIIVILDSI